MKIVFKFQASWCAPCKSLSEVVKNTDDLDTEFIEIDIDVNIEMAKQFNIRTVPTLVMMSGRNAESTEVRRITGSLTQEQLREFINGTRKELREFIHDREKQSREFING